MNLATFEGWICSNEEGTDTDEEFVTRLAFNPEGIGVVCPDVDHGTDECPQTIIIMRGQPDEWYIVKGKYEDVLTILKQAGKRY